MDGFSKVLTIGAACVLAGCASTQDEQAHFRPAQGWSLCSAPLPVDPVGFAPAAEDWTQDERTNVAGAVARAFALRCDASETIAQRAQTYRGITAMPAAGAVRARVYPAADSPRLIVALPEGVDYRSDALLADLRIAITCALAPGEIVAPAVCPAA
jgi:hypothetical protein